jgi:hypothetical protein
MWGAVTPTPVPPLWLTATLPVVAGLAGAIVGGGIAMLNSYLTERRRERRDAIEAENRERVLLTGLYAIRNFIVERLSAWNVSGRSSELIPLKTASEYLNRIIAKAPVEGEYLMNAMMDLGLRIDVLLETLSWRPAGPDDERHLADLLQEQAIAVEGNIELFDIMAKSRLMFLTEEDLARFARGKVDTELAEPSRG